jgi:GDP-L-fucose synthase
MLQYQRPFISIMPTNLYGPADNYDLKNSHVLPALIRKFHEAKVNRTPEVIAWGSGQPLREFMYSDDLADALVFCMEKYEDVEHLNVGSGQEISIRDLTSLIQRIVGYGGEVVWDSSKPDGTPRKMMDSSRLQHMGWKPQFSLEQGIRLAYQDFINRHDQARK